MDSLIAIGAIVVVGGVLALKGFTTVRQTEKGVVERLGKFNRVTSSGLVLLIPFLDECLKINITEQIADAKPQEVITKDSLNAIVDAQVYYKVRDDDKSVCKSQYGVNNYAYQIVQLARTTLRDLIGNKNLTEVNSQRMILNDALAKELRKQTEDWGIEVVRCELKEIQPPQDVQSVMNEVVVAEKKKVAAIDFATAAETNADGTKRAAIRNAEGEKQAKILRAQGDAQATVLVAQAEAEKIKLVNESAKKYFQGDAQAYRKLQVAENVLQQNTKIIVPQGSDIVNVVGDVGSQVIVPTGKKK